MTGGEITSTETVAVALLPARSVMIAEKVCSPSARPVAVDSEPELVSAGVSQIRGNAVHIVLELDRLIALPVTVSMSLVCVVVPETTR